MAKMISRRQFLTIGGTVAAVSVLSACGATPTPTPVPPTAVPTKAPTAVPTAAATAAPPAVPTAIPTKAPTVAPTAAPAKTDKLIAATGTGSNVSVRNFNPFVSTSAMLGAGSFAYEPLLIINGISAEIVPWLATGYKFSDDAKTLTFTIRKGVKWSDGEPFTAKDVVFTFMLLRTKTGLQGVALSAMNAQAGYVDTVTAPDDYTVVFTFKRAYSLAIYELPGQPIVPEHIWKSIDDPSKFTNENPVGTGPFTEIKNFSQAGYEIRPNPTLYLGTVV